MIGVPLYFGLRDSHLGFHLNADPKAPALYDHLSLVGVSLSEACAYSGVLSLVALSLVIYAMQLKARGMALRAADSAGLLFGAMVAGYCIVDQVETMGMGRLPPFTYAGQGSLSTWVEVQNYYLRSSSYWLALNAGAIGGFVARCSIAAITNTVIVGNVRRARAALMVLFAGLLFGTTWSLGTDIMPRLGQQQRVKIHDELREAAVAAGAIESGR